MKVNEEEIHALGTKENFPFHRLYEQVRWLRRKCGQRRGKRCNFTYLSNEAHSVGEAVQKSSVFSPQKSKSTPSPIPTQYRGGKKQKQ